MANYTAADVKKLRDLTDAPMMECKAALEEAEGDFEKAQEILKQKGKAAAGKRVDRATGEGVVAISVASDSKSAGVAVLECETDFVARNEDFIKTAQDFADAFLVNDPGSDPSSVAINGSTIGEQVEAAVARIRENIKVSKAAKIANGNYLVGYVHHDKKKGAVVEFEGENLDADAARKVAIQVVALSPEVVSKEQLSQERLSAEIETQTKRAMEEGKPENIAKNIAEGRVNKEWVKQVVLLEQGFYADASKSVAQYLTESLGGAKVVAFHYFKVGS
jgi:elongation factor Ts